MIGQLRHIIGLIVAVLVTALGAVAMPLAPSSLHQAEFLPYQHAFIAEHANVDFEARGPPMAAANVALTGATIAEHGNGVVMHGHEIHVASLSFGADFDAPNNIPNPPSLTISNSQWGTKIAKHTRDFGLDVSNPAHRQQLRDKVESIGSNPDRVVTGTFSGGGPNGRRDVLFYVKGNDVVVTSPAGEFVTVLQNGVTNPNVMRALDQ